MAKPTPHENPARDVGEFLIGVQDCLITMGLAMVHRGLLTREEIAGAFEEALEQQRSRPDCQTPVRQIPVKAMAEFFRLPVYDEPN